MKVLVFLISLFFLVSCSESLPPIQTVQNFDLNRYDGEWHELARLPNRFERNLIAAKATYGVGLEGPVRILNEGLRSNGEATRITGTAKPVGDGKLEVRFDPFPANLFPGDYWILWIDENYERAIVGTPDRKYLWILSKDPGDILSDFAETTPNDKSTRALKLKDSSKILNVSRQILVQHSWSKNKGGKNSQWIIGY
jgi:apolipoprotein D and lipocalin family protein